MLLGSPLRADTSRSGNASPDDRNADRTREEWTTALTRYGSRGGGIFELILSCSRGPPRSLALGGAASPRYPLAGHPVAAAASGTPSPRAGRRRLFWRAKRPAIVTRARIHTRRFFWRSPPALAFRREERRRRAGIGLTALP